MVNPEKLAKIKKRLELAEAHVHSYIDHIAECEPKDRGLWEDAIADHRHEVQVLQWVVKVLEE